MRAHFYLSRSVVWKSRDYKKKIILCQNRNPHTHIMDLCTEKEERQYSMILLNIR